MPLNQINNTESGSIVRGKLNAWLAQLLTNITNIATNTTNIGNLTSGLSTTNSNVASNTSSIGTLTSGLATANSNISTNTTNIANLDVNKQENRDQSTVFDTASTKSATFSVDTNNIVYVFAGNGILINIVPNSGTTIPRYGVTYISNIGSDAGVITPGIGVTILYHNGTSNILNPDETAILKKIDTDKWIRIV